METLTLSALQDRDIRTQEQRDLGIELEWRQRVARNVLNRERPAREEAERRLAGRKWLSQIYRQRQERTG